MTTSKPTKKVSTTSMKQSKLAFSSAKSATRTGKSKKRIAPPPPPSPSETAPVSSSSDEEEDVSQEERVAVVDEVRELLKLNDARWKAPLRWANQKTEMKHTIHAKGQNKIDHILRVFDNSHEYGPCVGISRLQRWERAQNLGLNPPAEVRDILLTQQGSVESRYSQTCFNEV